MSGLHKAFCSFQSSFYSFVTNFGPYFGYNTIGTPGIASILDFQKSTALSGKTVQRGQGRSNGIRLFESGLVYTETVGSICHAIIFFTVYLCFWGIYLC